VIEIHKATCPFLVMLVSRIAFTKIAYTTDTLRTRLSSRVYSHEKRSKTSKSRDKKVQRIKELVLLLVGIMEVELLGSGQVHHDVEQSELTGGERTDHHASGAQASEAQLLEANLLGEVDQTAGNGASSSGSLGLVDHRQQSVGGVRHDGSHHTCDDTRAQRDGDLGVAGGGLHVVASDRVDLLSSRALHSELRHGVGHLLEKDGAKARVEALKNAVLFNNLGECIEQSRGKLGVGHQADAGGFQGAEEDISDELSHGRSAQIDGSSVLPSLLLSNTLSDVDLEELNTTKLEPSLNKITHGSRSEAGGQSGSSLFCDDLAESADHTLVVLDGVQLHSCLHDIDWAERAVSDSAADSSGQGALEVVIQIVDFFFVRRFDWFGCTAGSRLHQVRFSDVVETEGHIEMNLITTPVLRWSHQKKRY